MNENNNNKKLKKIEVNMRKINKLLSRVDELLKELYVDDELKGDAEKQSEEINALPPIRSKSIILSSLSI